MNRHLSARELAFCGLFGAAALLLPILFHLVHLGRIFMPMYLPLCTLPFFVRPYPAAATAALTPIISAALTGMPPFFPPTAVFMAVELSCMAALIAFVMQRRPKTNEWLLLTWVLLVGRVLYIVMTYAFALVIELPAKFMAGVSLISGWPGILLMIAVVPPLVRAGRKTGVGASSNERIFK